MAKAITMPKLGQSEEEALLVRWFKKEGDPVAKGDVLFEIETEKATLEVESFFEGTLLKTVVPQGQTVPINSVVGYIGEPGEKVPGAPETLNLAETALDPGPSTDARGEASERAAATRFDLSSQPQPEAPAGAEPAAGQGTVTLRVSPRAARLAAEHGIHPADVQGSGPGGRVTERDIQARIAESERAPTPASAQQHSPNIAAAREVDASLATPLSRMRQTIAARMVKSATSAPHFFVTVSADVTDLESLRGQLKREGAAYTLTDFILKAAASALVEFPLINSVTDGNTVLIRPEVHLGLAVTIDDGLVVPVIRNAEQLSLHEIHGRASDLTALARAGRLTPEQMTGSTFTISNMGMLDVENFTAIINPGESAILAVSSVLKQPAVRNDQVVVRSMMKMTLSSDHRLIDGALAARFLNAIRSRLEDPAGLLA